MLKDRYVVYVHTYKLCENIAYLTIMQYLRIIVLGGYNNGLYSNYRGYKGI